MNRTLLLLTLAACGADTTAPAPDDPAAATDAAITYHRDAAPVIAAKCGGCHVADGIGPFSLTTFDEVSALAGPIQNAIAAGTMPPWQGGDDCNAYRNDYSLTDAEEELLLAWLADGAPEGDPADAVDVEPPTPFAADLLLPLPEPYTPTAEPDDYRCQLLEWPLDETGWITGLRVEADQTAIVHHTIVFATSADGAQAYRDMDAADPGPGYTCFGGPTAGQGGGFDLSDLDLADLLEAVQSGELDLAGGTRWLGAWVPGVQDNPYPDGVGLRMEPGDVLIVQMHYNTLSASPVADQSAVAFQVADSVEREAMVLPFTDIGWVTGMEALGGPMDIPAYNPDVVHETSMTADGVYFASARKTLGLPDDSPLVVHSAAHHMHLLGKTGHQEVRHADGSTTCMVDVPDWDFSWQGGFAFDEPVVLQPEDELVLRCGWDNSEANQPIVDGEVQVPRDVQWGEGSTDEMCLSTLFLTGP